MFGKKKKELNVKLTLDDTVEINAVRDFLICVVFKRFSFIRHASATYGISNSNVAAEDYESTRIYEGIAEEVVDHSIRQNELQNMKDELGALQDKLDERIALD